MNVVLRTVGPGGDAEAREVTWTELAAAAAPLASQEEHCRACPANFLGHAYGCYGATNYPVPRVAEEWLMSRLQLADQVGGFLCLRMIADFGYDGAPIQNMRRAGLFEASAPVSKILQKGFLSKKSVDSNQVLQAILAISEPLDPSHVMGVLVWIGGIALDGAVPTSMGDAPSLQALSQLDGFAERSARTRLELGPPSDDPGIAGMQRLLAGLYAAFLNNAPTLVWP